MPVEEKNDLMVVPVLLSITGGKQPGEFEKLITVKTNIPGNPELPVTIAGIVVGEAKAFPPVVFFGEVKPDTKTAREMSIIPTNNNTLHIEKVIAHSPSITVEILPARSGNECTIRATLQNTKENTTIRDSLQVYTKGKTQPVLEIPVYARIVGSKE